MGQVEFCQECLGDVRGEIEPLLREHKSEVDHTDRPVNPDWETYESLEDLGLLKIFTARESGTLVGYFVAILSPDLHSKGYYNCVDDLFFISHPYRKGLTGYKLVKFVEDCLKADGVDRLYIKTTTKNKIDPFMVKLGYIEIETVWGKVL